MPIIKSGEKNFQVSKEVYKYLSQQPLMDSTLLYEKLSGKYPEELISKPAVWNAIKRWKDKNPDLLKLVRDNVYLPKDTEDAKDGISPVFKEMVKYAQWAERQGNPVSTQMILSFFKETHKLGANETDIIRQEQLVNDVAQKLYEFSDSLEWDPSIEDDEYLEENER